MSNLTRCSSMVVAGMLIALATGGCAGGETEPAAGAAVQEAVTPAPAPGSRDARNLGSTGRTAEPDAPDWLQVTPASDDVQAGETAFDVEIRPEASTDKDARLSVLEDYVRRLEKRLAALEPAPTK